MARVHVGVLGPTNVRLDGVPARLTPLTVKLLLRLIAAEGEAISVEQIYRDVWEVPANGRVARGERNEVQKRVLELRRAMDPEGTARILRTEQMLAPRTPRSAYRLTMDRAQLDYLEFEDLISRAAHAPPAMAAALLVRALEFWRGEPFMDVGGREFARPLTRRLASLHESAIRDLIRVHTELGHPESALPLAEKLAAGLPGDPDVAGLLRQLREQLRARHTGDVLRREFPGLGATLIIRRGDLFEQEDANLAIGFGDTFDTSTEDDVVISRESVQGQLLERLYRGDKERLDADLRRGLRGFVPVAKETAQAKPRGKRLRYAVGTVLPVPLNGRRVFAFVHCRQDLDFVTRSTPEELRLSLDRLWQSIRIHGLRKPVAIPLVGAGLSRIDELTREQLVIMIIDTFVRNCRDERCTPELRIVIRPSEIEATRISDVARFVETLDQNGQGPDE
jgi:Domain of unknown function (DUF6430)/Bacterial transcriptional activator domain